MKEANKPQNSIREIAWKLNFSAIYLFFHVCYYYFYLELRIVLQKVVQYSGVKNAALSADDDGGRTEIGCAKTLVASLEILSPFFRP